MKIYLGTDHAGFKLKEELKVFLMDLGHTLEDKGALEYNEGDDYPDFITAVAEAVANDTGSMGIILGGSGEGEAMCANRIKGVRAVLYYGGMHDIVKIAREHNDANILSLGARFVSFDEAKHAVLLFTETHFSNDERHVRRLAKF